MLTKVDSTDYNFIWATPSGGGGLVTQLYASVWNAESVQINKGQPVYLYQATGDRASVKLAFNTSEATSAKTLGLAAEDIPAGYIGNVICQGELIGVDTSEYMEGDSLYLGDTPGSLTITKPFAPNHMVSIGVVEKANAGAGQIYVRIQNGFELEELHNVQISSAQSDHILVYDLATGLWKNLLGTSKFAAVEHTHDIDDVTGLQGQLDLKQAVITSGTAAPTGGVDGDFYFQYT